MKESDIRRKGSHVSETQCIVRQLGCEMFSTGRFDNSFVWVKVGRLLLRLLGPGCWLLWFLLLLHPTRTQNPRHMLGLGLLLLLVGRTSALPRRVDLPKTCLPLLWIYSNSGGHWRRPVQWRRGSWGIVSGMALCIVFLTRRGERVAVVLVGTDDARGKCRLELEMRSEGFGLGITAGRRSGIVFFVFKICGIPDLRTVVLFGWLALFITRLVERRARVRAGAGGGG